MMQTEQIVALLIQERNRLDAAIQALQYGTKRRGRPPGNKASAAIDAPTSGKRKRKLSAAGRKAISDAAKRRWAAIRAGKAPSPFSKGKGKKAAKG